jgi:hypothetical protein
MRAVFRTLGSGHMVAFGNGILENIQMIVSAIEPKPAGSEEV